MKNNNYANEEVEARKRLGEKPFEEEIIEGCEDCPHQIFTEKNETRTATEVINEINQDNKEKHKWCGKERSSLWDKFIDIIDEQFPKNECKERGKALVMLAYMDMEVSKFEQKHQEELAEAYQKGLKENMIKVDKEMVDWMKNERHESLDFLEGLKEDMRKELVEKHKQELEKLKAPENGTNDLKTGYNLAIEDFKNYFITTP